MSVEAFSNKDWQLTIPSVTAIDSIVITSITRTQEGDSKDLRSSDGKLVKRYVYDQREKYDVECVVRFANATVGVSNILNDLYDNVVILSVKDTASTYTQKYTGQVDAGSYSVKYSNEDYAVLSFSITPSSTGTDLQEFQA